MASLSGPTSFNADAMEKARFWYERLPYTYYDGAMAPGSSPVIAEPDLATPLGTDQLAVVSGVALTPTSGLSLVWQGDGPNVYTEPASGWPAGLQPIMAGDNRGVRARQNLTLTLTNNTGAALGMPLQLNYLGAVKTLTVAEKLLLGVPLSAAEQALASQYNLQTPPPAGWAGLRPSSLRRQLDLLFQGAVLTEEWQTYTIPSVGQAQGQPFAQVAPRNSGEIVIWTEVWGSVAAADVGKGIMLTTQRDGQANTNVLLLDNASPSYPWHPWCVAKNQLWWSLNANVATANPVSVRIHWLRVTLTAVLAVLLSLASPADLAGPDRQLYDMARAGILA